MNCSRELIGGYLDQELDLTLHTEVEQHLAGCQICTEMHSQLSKQREEVRSLAPYYTAPARLQHSVREALKKNVAAEAGIHRAGVSWRWLAIAACLLFASSLAWNLALLQSRKTDRDVLLQSLIASHVRSLIGTHLLDVASTDQHTVKPWFNGKIDFSPQVKDFGPQGFPLIGGRLEYAANRTVAALVYRHRQHMINVFTWPSNSAEIRESRFVRNGFNAIHWADAGMTYWAVSDLNSVELQEFRKLYSK